MQAALDRLSLWLLEWGLVVNPAKSKTMFFTRKKITNLPQLVLNGGNIPLVTTHKFLGLYLDAPLLLWKKNITYLKETCLDKLRIMKALAGSSWGCDRKSLLTFTILILEVGCLMGLRCTVQLLLLCCLLLKLFRIML